MRKLFWGLGICWACVLGTTAWASYYAARHPHSVVGRVMHGASTASIRLSPIGGFANVVSKLQQKPLAHDEVEGIPDDPVPVDDGKWSQPAEVNEIATAAPIVIPDDDVDDPKPTIRPVQHETFEPDTECPAESIVRAPAVMPFCEEECEAEVLPMPTQEKEEPEELPMPKLEEDGEQQEASGCTKGCPTGLMGQMFRLFAEQQQAKDETPAASGEQGSKQPDECREDPHHYQHTGCPNAGRPAGSCPVKPSCMPSCDPPKPSGEEPSEESDEHSCKTALQKLLRIKTREAVEASRPQPVNVPSVDTMEMRPSDRPAGDHGPGLL